MARADFVRSLSMAMLVAVPLLAGTAGIAAELPILGEFGDPSEDGCKSLKEGTEGSYIGFERGGGFGAGGEGGCTFSKVEKTTANGYKLSGVCFSLDGPKKRATRTLTIKSKDEIVFEGTRFVRCK